MDLFYFLVFPLKIYLFISYKFMIMNNMKNMKLSVFNGITYNKYKVDVMKSGLQKYIRRGNIEKSIYCMVELDLFKKLNDKKVKGLRSNIRNRLLVILVEDIGISNWMIYEKIYNLLNKWEEKRYENNDEDKLLLTKVVLYLVNSKKIRLCSWIKAFYGYCVDDENLKKYYKNKEDLKDNKKNCGERFYKDKDEDEIKEMIDGIVYNLDKDSDNLFYWIFKLLKSNSKNGRRGRKSKKGFIVWDILKEYVKKNKEIEKIYNYSFEWYEKYNNSRDENILFMLNMILFYLRRDKINWKEKLEELKIEDEDILKYYNKNMTGEKIEIDDFIVDMHVKKGRKMKKWTKDFANNGSVVNNEDERFVIEEYKNIYNDYKIIYNDKKKVVKKTKKNVKKSVKKVKKKKLSKFEDLEYIDFKELLNIKDTNDLNDKMCRKKTCGNKAMTFYNENIIVKEMRKSFNYGKDCCIVDDLKYLFNIKKMNCRRVRSNMIVKKKDRKNKMWENNMELEEKDCVYLIMDNFENVGTLVKNKKKRLEDKIKMEYLKILIFRGIFKVTDGNYTNVLINENDVLLSIDENNIGKREKILERRTSKCYNEGEVNKVIDDILNNKEEKKEKIKEKLEEYKMVELYEEIEKRFDNLREIVLDECKNLKMF